MFSKINMWECPLVVVGQITSVPVTCIKANIWQCWFAAAAWISASGFYFCLLGWFWPAQLWLMRNVDPWWCPSLWPTPIWYDPASILALSTHVSQPWQDEHLCLQIFGRMYFIAGYVDSEVFQSILNKTDSSWIQITQFPDDPQKLNMFESSRMWVNVNPYIQGVVDPRCRRSKVS